MKDRVSHPRSWQLPLHALVVVSRIPLPHCSPCWANVALLFARAMPEVPRTCGNTQKTLVVPALRPRTRPTTSASIEMTSCHAADHAWRQPGSSLPDPSLPGHTSNRRESPLLVLARVQLESSLSLFCCSGICNVHVSSNVLVLNISWLVRSYPWTHGSVDSWIRGSIREPSVDPTSKTDPHRPKTNPHRSTTIYPQLRRPGDQDCDLCAVWAH